MTLGAEFDVGLVRVVPTVVLSVAEQPGRDAPVVSARRALLPPDRAILVAYDRGWGRIGSKYYHLP